MVKLLKLWALNSMSWLSCFSSSDIYKYTERKKNWSYPSPHGGTYCLKIWMWKEREKKALLHTCQRKDIGREKRGRTEFVSRFGPFFPVAPLVRRTAVFWSLKRIKSLFFHPPALNSSLFISAVNNAHDFKTKFKKIAFLHCSAHWIKKLNSVTWKKVVINNSVV